MVKNKNIPTPVKVISILTYIGSGLNLLFSLVLILGSSFIAGLIANMTPNDPVVDLIGTIGVGVLIGFGILILLIAILEFFVAKGIWEGKNWARIVLLVIASIAVFFSVMRLIVGDFSTIIGILIYGFIIYYLGFEDKTKNYFLK